MTVLDIQVGDMRDRITFQSPTISKSSGGGQVEAYANVLTNPTVWALWVNDHGQEVVANDAEKAVQRATVTIRNRSDVLTTWQVLKEDGSAWKLISPPDHVRGRQRWTVLRVERVIGTV
jgi:SPP1 family predicted phage head-tail adaptor